jgi:hypothetical protein
MKLLIYKSAEFCSSELIPVTIKMKGFGNFVKAAGSHHDEMYMKVLIEIADD